MLHVLIYIYIDINVKDMWKILSMRVLHLYALAQALL